MQKLFVVVPLCATMVGCAVLPTAIKPTRVAVISKAPTDGEIANDIRRTLADVHGRQSIYLKEYNRLAKEQSARDVTIMGASVALAGTSTFRGNAHSLKYAGFGLGLATFYDKVFPITDRISSASATIQNFNGLILTTNRLLVQKIDVDFGDLEASNTALTMMIDKANVDVANAELKTNTPCPTSNAAIMPNFASAKTVKALKAALAQAGKAYDASQKCLSDLTDQANKNATIADLKAQLKTSQTTLDAGHAAFSALQQSPQTVLDVSAAIDKAGILGGGLKFDAPTAEAGFLPATPKLAPPKASTSPTSGNLLSEHFEIPLAPSSLDQDLAKLKTTTSSVQRILDRVDYVALVKAIVSTAPPAPTPVPAKPAATN